MEVPWEPGLAFGWLGEHVRGGGPGEGGWPCVRECGLLVQVRSDESRLPPLPVPMKVGPGSPLLPVGLGIQHWAQHEAGNRKCLMSGQATE